MKKIYFPFLLIASLASTSLFAQRTNKLQLLSGKSISFKRIINARTTAAGCDTVNLADALNWSSALYYGDGIGDWITGTNTYGDLQKAQYFDLSATSNTYLTKVWVLPGIASSLTATKAVPVRIYDGTSGTPTTPLAVSNLTIGDYMTAVDSGDVVEAIFSPAVNLPASKKFFVSVDFSTLTATTDTIAIYSSAVDETAALAWEQFDNGNWHRMDDDSSWGVNLSLYIFPFVSDNVTCTVLPVNLVSFNAKKANNNVELNWKVTSESNMKYYQVERSTDSKSFTAAGQVSAINSTSTHGYTFVDNNAPAGKLFYRLRQVNKDGKSLYSNVLSLNDRSVSGIKIGGFTGGNIIPLYINSTSSQKLSAALYDLQGRMVSKTTDQAVIAGANNLNITVNPNTSKGVYILNVTMEDGSKYNYKVFKQ